MNLKEAYRYQNVMTEAITDALMILTHSGVAVKKTYTNYVSKVVDGMPDETFVDDPRTSFEHTDKMTDLANFVLYLLAEKEKLAWSIRVTKVNTDFDVDSQIGLNGIRRKIAKAFRDLDSYRAEEKVVKNGGTGYRFDANGNQVEFRCDQKVVKELTFDKEKVRQMRRQIESDADMISSEIDAAMVNAVVNFEPHFDPNDSFDAMFDYYLDQLI